MRGGWRASISPRLRTYSRSPHFVDRVAAGEYLSSAAPLAVMSLVEDEEGALSNLSTPGRR